MKLESRKAFLRVESIYMYKDAMSVSYTPADIREVCSAGIQTTRRLSEGERYFLMEVGSLTWVTWRENETKRR